MSRSSGISVEVHEIQRILGSNVAFVKLTLFKQQITIYVYLVYSWAVKGAVVTIGSFVKLLLAPVRSATSKRQHSVCCSPAPFWRVPLGHTGPCSTRFRNRACRHC
jgi:hypothetical protein